MAKRLGVVVAITAALLAVLLSGIQLCPTARILHVPCPGCGMTRAALSALHGQFAQSFRYHPLAIVAVPFLATSVLGQVVSYVSGGSNRISELLAHRWVDHAMWVLLVLMIVVWIARFFGAFGGPAPV